MFAIVLLSSCPPSMRRAKTLVSRESYNNPLLVCLYFFFGEAFFEAFSGSSVVPPANPRRSRGGAFAFEIKTYPSRGPGTAPSTIKRRSEEHTSELQSP